MIKEVPKPSVRVIAKHQMLHRHWLGGQIHVAESGQSSHFGFACTLATMRAGGGPSWHVHTREEECFYIRRGVWEFEAYGQDRIRVGPGELVTLPIGIPHRFEVLDTDVDDSDGQCVLWTCPGGNAQFFIELSNPLDESEDKTMPPDLSAMTQMGHRFGIWMLDPDDEPEDFVLPLGRNRRAIVRGIEGDGHAWNGSTMHWLAESNDTAGQCEIVMLNLPPHTSLPVLQHGRYEIGAVVLDGEVQICSESQRHIAPSDAMVHLPFGVPYQWSTGENPAQVLLLSTPHGLSSFFKTGVARGHGVVASE